MEGQIMEQKALKHHVKVCRKELYILNIALIYLNSDTGLPQNIFSQNVCNIALYNFTSNK